VLADARAATAQNTNPRTRVAVKVANFLVYYTTDNTTGIHALTPTTYNNIFDAPTTYNNLFDNLFDAQPITGSSSAPSHKPDLNPPLSQVAQSEKDTVYRSPRSGRSRGWWPSTTGGKTATLMERKVARCKPWALLVTQRPTCQIAALYTHWCRMRKGLISTAPFSAEAPSRSRHFAQPN
jgi:hypothetical protein